MRRPPAVLLAGVALGLPAFAGLHEWRGVGYWNYSEGVYALTARLLVDGRDVWGGVVAAQPPWQFLYGGALLVVSDSIEWLRAGVGLLQLAGGLIAGAIVWRLTGSRLAAVIAVPLALLTPWAAREHGALTPETVAVPLLLGSALLAARPGTVPAAALLASMTVFTKYPFVLPAVAVCLFAADRRRALVWLAAGVGVQAAVFTGLFGLDLWRDTVAAQLGTGGRNWEGLKGSWVQGAWNLLPLVVPAGIAWAGRDALRDQALLRSQAALAIGLLATMLTTYKQGTALNIALPVEAGLVPLALCAPFAAGGARRWVAAGAIAVCLAQTLSLIASDRTAAPFLYPGNQEGAWGQVADHAGVRAEERRARACPTGVPYSGHPYYAFVAERPMPADQPDGFLTMRSDELSDVAARVAAVRERCP